MFRRARRTLLLAAAGAMMLTAVVPAASAQAYSVGNYYKLVSFPGFCADILSYNTQLFSGFCQQGDGSQKWLLESSSDAGEYKFHNQYNGGCITDQNNNAWDALCSGGENTQRFASQSTSQAGYYKVVVESNGQCLTETAGDPIVFQACAQGDGDQYWELQAAS